MVSLTIELEEEKSEKLRRLAASKGWSVAELLRSGVDLLLRSGDSLTQSKAVGAGLKLSKKESSLLLGINRGLPPDAAERYRELVIRRREKRLSPTEHQELIRLSDEVESLQACRLESLGELARLRGATLRSVMDELGIAPAADA